MGIQDRDYYKKLPPHGGFGHFNAWSITTWLIVINVLALFADGFLQRTVPPPNFDVDEVQTQAQVNEEMISGMSPLERYGYLSIDKAIYHGQIWRFLTFQFLHASPWHLIANMIGLYFFGPIVEGQFGPRRFLGFYLTCGLAGAACFVLLGLTHFLKTDAATPLVGASAGIFGMLVAAAVIAPDVQLFYYMIPVTIRMAAIVGMLMAAYAVLTPNQYNAGGQAAHLGGGILGFLLIKNQHWLNPFVPARTEVRASVPQRRRRRAYQKDWSKDMNR